MAQSELANHALANESQPPDLRVVGSRAGPQPVHEGGPLREQEQHDHQYEKQVAQKAGDAGQDDPDGPGERPRLHHLAEFHVREPQRVYEDLDGRQPLVQFGRVVADARAEAGYRGAEDVEDHHEQQGHPEQHDHERRRRGNPAPSQPGVDRAEQERKDHGEEGRIEDRRCQAHPDEHDHRHGKDTQHPHE